MKTSVPCIPRKLIARQLPGTVLIAMLMLLAGCSGIPKREDDRETLQRFMQYADLPVDRFTKLGGITGWRPLGRDHLVVWTNINDAYLLTVSRPCDDLRFANTIGVTSTGSSITTFDKVLAGNDRCPIVEIRPVDYKRMKQDMRELKD
jgi:hypothetical protein